MDAVRVDKWLWAARFFKTRALATDAVLGGHVQLNGARVKPAKDVRVGDALLIRIGTLEWIGRRARARRPARAGDASRGRSTRSAPSRKRGARAAGAAAHGCATPIGADLGARPTKQDRRRLDALRRGQRRPR